MKIRHAGASSAKPLVFDLYSGLHGWCEGFIAEGYRCVAFDIVDMCKLVGVRRPRNVRLVLRDVTKLTGSDLVREFGVPAVIVASPPCQEYSYMAMPWNRAKERARKYGSGELNVADLTLLFDTCFRIQREVSEAAGRCIPLIVENVRGAQKWVGAARWHFGSYYLWGDVPALMPVTWQLKQPGRNFHFPEKYGIPSPSFHGHSEEPSVRDALALKTVGHLNIRDVHSHTRHLTNQAEHLKMGWDNSVRGKCRRNDSIGISGPRNNGKGDKWFQDGAATFGSKSSARKAASAQIAKIPFPLAQHIARVFKPEIAEAA